MRNRAGCNLERSFLDWCSSTYGSPFDNLRASDFLIDLQTFASGRGGGFGMHILKQILWQVGLLLDECMKCEWDPLYGTHDAEQSRPVGHLTKDECTDGTRLALWHPPNYNDRISREQVFRYMCGIPPFVGNLLKVLNVVDEGI